MLHENNKFFLTSSHLIFLLITGFLHFHLPPFQFSLFNFPLSFISSFFFLFSPSFPFLFHLTPLYSKLQQKFSLGKQTYYFTHSQLLLLVARSCLTLLGSHALQPIGSSVHGIPQERILEWVAIPFSRGFSQPRENRVFCIGRQVLYH